MEENVDIIQAISYDAYCSREKAYKYRYLHLKQIKYICVNLCFKKSFENIYQIECNKHFRTELPLSFGNLYKVLQLLPWFRDAGRTQKALPL